MDVLTGLQAFIRESPSAFHTVAALRARLLDAGFAELREAERWTLTPGQGYFVTRNGSSILSFRLPERQAKALHIIASHSDSPAFKLKPEPAPWSDGLLRLNVEGYGGMIRRGWTTKRMPRLSPAASSSRRTTPTRSTRTTRRSTIPSTARG